MPLKVCWYSKCEGIRTQWGRRGPAGADCPIRTVLELVGVVQNRQGIVAPRSAEHSHSLFRLPLLLCIDILVYGLGAWISSARVYIRKAAETQGRVLRLVNQVENTINTWSFQHPLSSITIEVHLLFRGGGEVGIDYNLEMGMILTTIPLRRNNCPWRSPSP